jgi:sugar lactone lactonase YvrE
VLAGALGGEGSADGNGGAARFSYPGGIATDSAGNLYVADNGNRTVRKITAAGVVTTLAGTAGQEGYADGKGSAARFCGPAGVAADSAGNVYVADICNDTIRKITPAGVVSTLAGTARQPGNADGVGAAAGFFNPTGIATDSAGNVYVTDNSAIRKITPAGIVSTLAGSPAQLSSPSGIVIDSVDNVYVADSGGVILKITPAGVVSTLAGTRGQPPGSTDGIGGAAQFNDPSGIARDSAGNLYVADTGNGTIRKITPAGVVSTLAGSAGQVIPGSADGTGTAAEFSGPKGVAADSAGNVYVADTYNHTIRKITPAALVSTLAGAALQSGSADADGSAARFFSPNGAATDSAGNVYVADHGNYTIRKITSSGVVSTLAGTAGQFGSADGIGAAARFHSSFYTPGGIATDLAGNVYVADDGNDTIRKITPAGVVSTLAGTAGQPGSADGTGAAARFYFSTGIATDSAGNVYVADNGDAIRKITPAGVVSTLAGTAGQSGFADGIGAAARFYFPTGVATDSANNVYVADTDNHTIRKITPLGEVSTLAGVAGQAGSADGSGGAARFNFPKGVATDSAGNVYVADTDNHTIRKITPIGAVTTVAGTAGMQGVQLGPLPGSLNQPLSIAVLPGAGVKLVEVGAEYAVLEISLP